MNPRARPEGFGTNVRPSLLKCGYQPIPLNGKRPTLPNWTEIVADENTIERWGSERPSDFNTGVLTKYTAVIDVDILDPAVAEAIAELVQLKFHSKGKVLRRTGKAPKFAIPFKTTLPFKKSKLSVTSPNEPKATKLGDCKQAIEILADGQQFVVFGVHPDTKLLYNWADEKIWNVNREDLPLLNCEEAKEFLNDVRKLLIEHGWRIFEETTSKEKTIDSEKTADSDILIVQLATKLWGPPTQIGKDLRFGSNQSKTVNPFKRIWFDFENNTGGDELKLIRLAESKLENEADNKPENESDQESHGSSLRWYGETDPFADQKWLVQSLLPERGSGLLSGQTATYKTFVALDIAAAVIAGNSFLNFPIRLNGGVLYVAAEGADTISLRVRAVIEEKYNDDGKIPLAWTNTSPRLVETSATVELCKIAAEAHEKMLSDFGVPLRLIVVDTLTVAAGYEKAGEENDSAVGQRVMTTLAQVAQNSNTFVLGVDHFGKTVESGTRGSSAKEAAADVVLALLADKTSSGVISNARLAIRKRRSGEAGVEFNFRRRIVDLGFDQFGEQLKSLIIEWLPPGAKANRQEPWRATTTMRTLRDALAVALKQSGSTRASDSRTIAVALTDLWREFKAAYEPTCRDPDPEKKRKASEAAFRRALERARSEGLIQSEDREGDEVVWEIEQPM